MAFVRTKKIRGRDYYYLVENRRVDGKIKQKTIASLGEHSTIESAIEALEKEAERIERRFAAFFRPYLWVSTLTEELRGMDPYLNDLSDEEVIALRRLATYIQRIGEMLQRFDKGFDRMMKERRRGQKLRKKAELLRKYRSA